MSNAAEYVVPIVTFVLGFLLSRLTMTKKERRDFEQGQYNNALALADQQKKAYESFTSALQAYVAKKQNSFEDFMAISSTGDTYFYQLKLVGDAILSGKIESHMRDATLLPLLEEATEKSIPAYYEALTNIAIKNDFPYEGSLKRKNYESIYSAVEKYSNVSQRA